SNLRGVIYTPTQISRFASLDALVSLPPGYEEMLVSNLAVRLCPSYSRSASPELRAAAVQSKAICKRSNYRPEEMSFGADALIGNQGGGYSIYEG
ncbi:MAG TPA: hypothetical protein VFO85_01140, partial [Vicinamibacteria bacterium]|nr:hypothetical protein [Vicinamibacteria bacterium]